MSRGRWHDTAHEAAPGQGGLTGWKAAAGPASTEASARTKPEFTLTPPSPWLSVVPLAVRGGKHFPPAPALRKGPRVRDLQLTVNLSPSYSPKIRDDIFEKWSEILRVSCSPNTRPNFSDRLKFHFLNIAMADVKPADKVDEAIEEFLFHLKVRQHSFRGRRNSG